MNVTGRTGSLRKALLAGLAGALLPAAALAAQGQAPTPVPPGTPVTITVTQAAPSAPPVSLTLGPRHGHVTPIRQGCTHTGGGNIGVAQPSPDTVVITMTGVAVAYCGPRGGVANMTFDLDQCFEIAFDNPDVKRAKLTMEARVIGLLRSHHKGGTAGYSDAVASVLCGPETVLSIAAPPHDVSGGENLSVNDTDGPCSAPVLPGKYNLRQTFVLTAAAEKCLLPAKAPSAEFAPEPALDPLWISYKEPFHGAAKNDFGFQVTIRVADDTPKENGNGKSGNGNGTNGTEAQPDAIP